MTRIRLCSWFAAGIFVLGGVPTALAEDVACEATNQAPHFSGGTNVSAQPGHLVTSPLSATDPETGASVQVVVSGGMPNGASFSDGVFSWTPTSNDGGSHTVTFTATDNGYDYPCPSPIGTVHVGPATATFHLTITVTITTTTTSGGSSTSTTSNDLNWDEIMQQMQDKQNENNQPVTTTTIPTVVTTPQVSTTPQVTTPVTPPVTTPKKTTSPPTVTTTPPPVVETPQIVEEVPTGPSVVTVPMDVTTTNNTFFDIFFELTPALPTEPMDNFFDIFSEVTFYPGDMEGLMAKTGGDASYVLSLGVDDLVGDDLANTIYYVEDTVDDTLVTVAKDDCDEIRKLLEEARAALGGVQSAVTARNEQMVAKKKDCDELRRQLADAETELDTALRAQGEATRAATAAEEDYNKAQRALARFEASIVRGLDGVSLDPNSGFDNFTEMPQGLFASPVYMRDNAAVEKFLQKLKDWEKDLKEYKKAEDDAAKKKDDAKKAADDAKAKADAAQAKVDDLRKKLEECERQVATMEGQNDAAGFIGGMIQDDISELEQKLKDCEQKAKSAASTTTGSPGTTTGATSTPSNGGASTTEHRTPTTSNQPPNTSNQPSTPSFNDLKQSAESFDKDNETTGWSGYDQLPEEIKSLISGHYSNEELRHLILFFPDGIDPRTCSWQGFLRGVRIAFILGGVHNDGGMIFDSTWKNILDELESSNPEVIDYLHNPSHSENIALSFMTDTTSDKQIGKDVVPADPNRQSMWTWSQLYDRGTDAVNIAGSYATGVRGVGGTASIGLGIVQAGYGLWVSYVGNEILNAGIRIQERELCKLIAELDQKNGTYHRPGGDTKTDDYGFHSDGKGKVWMWQLIRNDTGDIVSRRLVCWPGSDSRPQSTPTLPPQVNERGR